MITGIYYFYTDKIEFINNKKHYTVIKVNIYNNNVDVGNRKAKTLNDKLGFGKMPGGYFNGNCKTYWNDCTIIECRDNTKIQDYTEYDKYIIDLIEYENNLDYVIM